MTRIDLDELERKAKAVLADGCESFADAANHSHAYGLATEPPVTIALIAHIRELEKSLDESLVYWLSLDVASIGRIRQLRETLEKGAVLP